MPTYLVHGFRWDRVSIRVHIVIHDLEDAAPEWIVAPATSVTLLNSFYTLFDFLPPSNPPPASYPLASPADKVVIEDESSSGTRTLTKANQGSISNLRELVRRPLSIGGAGLLGGKEKEKEKDKEGAADGEGKKGNEAETRPTPSTGTSASTKPAPAAKNEKKPMFNDWSVVKLLEQYDENDLSCTSQPYAYVADYIVEVPLGVSITEEIAKYEAKIKEEESPLSAPGTPGIPGSPAVTSNEKGELISPPLSARELRRRSRRLGWFEKLRDGLQKGENIGWHVVVCGDEERAAPSVIEEEYDDSEGSDEQQRPPRSAGLRGFFGKKKNIPEE